jgi:hypothetical protein
MQTVRTNIKNNASTQYTNFEYNSVCVFNGKVLGAGSSGLFDTCNGNTDSGILINAYFVTSNTNFKDNGLKRLWFFILGLWSSGPVAITPFYNGVEANPITVVPKIMNSFHQIKKMFRDKLTKCTYSKFKFSNVAGSDFTVDSINVSTSSSSQSGM